MNKESKIGLTYSIILLSFFLLFPYYMWYKTAQIVDAKNKDYIELKNQVDYANKLLKAVEDLTAQNEELVKSENEYVAKYCAAINYSTKECTDFIKQTQKAIVNQNKVWAF